MITAGEVLKNKRELLKKSLEKVSLDTKIQKRFLEYIENNQFEYFDSEVFLTGFIKIYAQYLDLDTNKILALYRRSNPKKTPEKEKIKEKKVFTNKKKDFKKHINPKTLLTVLLTIFLLGIFAYIGYQIYRFQSPPRLDVLEPTDEAEFTTENIIVRGETEPDALIEINGTVVETIENGTFEKEIELNEGPNIITVRASKSNTLEKVETIKVTYIKEEEETEQEDEEKEENIITLEVFDSAAWVRLDIDDENKVSQVVEPSTLEWTIEEKLYVITGRVGNTRLLFNDNIVSWQANQTTGVAEMTCQIIEQALVCD